MGHSIFLTIFLKKILALHSLLFPKSERYYGKLLEFVIGICGLKYFRKVANEQVASFSKEQVF